MAPEIHSKQAYHGAAVDLFSCAVILFIMVSQHPPFRQAKPDDEYYTLICKNRADIFWDAHSRDK
jgi:hypothetical protein